MPPGGQRRGFSPGGSFAGDGGRPAAVYVRKESLWFQRFSARKVRAGLDQNI